MKRYTLSLIVSFISLFSVLAKTIELDSWQLQISEINGETDIYKGNAVLFSKIQAVFKIDETEYTASEMHFKGVQLDENYTDAFGSGLRVDLQYEQNEPELKVRHTYYLYTGKDFLLTELQITSSDTIASNYMSPLTVNTSSAFLPAENGTNAALIVPFDNDAWVRYGSYIFRTNTTHVSYEAGCLYNVKNADGLVLGSVEHDNWKTGVVSKVATPNRIVSLKVYGGISNNYSGTTPTTRDQLPHGKLKGQILKSPKVMLGYYDDWRDGMEEYGELNAIVAPKRAWNKGTPFGWNSWGNAQTSLSYAIATGVSAYYAEKLMPAFSNDNTVYIGLDSYWTNLTAQNRRRFVNDCKSRGQKPGIYWTPFVDWGGNFDKIVEGTNNQYTYRDIALKINGSPAEFPGGGKGWALDPTHIGTKMRMDYYIDQWINDGYEFLKIDFMTHGTFEADSWYDPEVTTGIQAYNQGMKYLSDKIGDKMYVNLSIAPLFPAQYANGRRFACDTYGSMQETQYALNALTHSWWTDRFYCYNDPDYMVFGRFDGGGAYPGGRNYVAYSLGENRARYTSVVTTGLCLLGDDFVNCSDEIRERAPQIVGNVEINRIAKIGKSFRPVFNEAWGSNQADLFMHREGDTVYLAAYHFTSTPSRKTFTLPYELIGLSSGEQYEVRELWTNTTEYTQSADTSLELKVPRLDVRVYKIYPGKPSFLGKVSSNDKIRIYPNPCRGELLYIEKDKSCHSQHYEFYSMTGSRLLSLPNHSGNTINVKQLYPGSYVLVATDSETNDRVVLSFIKA